MEFKNMEATRAGLGIRELRKRNGMSLEGFASKAGINADYLKLLEEGHEDRVSDEIIEHILEASNICKRSKKYTSEDLKRVLLSIRPPIPPAGKLM